MTDRQPSLQSNDEEEVEEGGNRPGWDLFHDHDSSSSGRNEKSSEEDDGTSSSRRAPGGNDDSVKKKKRKEKSGSGPISQPKWDSGLWIVEAGPIDGNWSSLDSLVVLSSSKNAAKYMSGIDGEDLKHAPLNPNPKDRYYAGSMHEYAEKGPVPLAAKQTLGLVGVRCWPGDDERDGFIRWVSGVPIERTARSMLFICVDVRLHGPIIEDTIKKLEAMQAFDWYRRKNRSHKHIAENRDGRDLVPVRAWKPQLEAAAKLDNSLLLVSRSGFDTYAIVAWNKVFGQSILARYGLNKHRLSFRLATRSTGDADWIESQKGTLVVFAWLEGYPLNREDNNTSSSSGGAMSSSSENRKDTANLQNNDELYSWGSSEESPPPNKRQRTLDGKSTKTKQHHNNLSEPRPLPLLLEAVENWTPNTNVEGPGIFCVRIISEDHYREKVPRASWLWFPKDNAVHFSDHVWSRLGWVRNETLPPHSPISFFELLDNFDARRVREALETLSSANNQSDHIELRLSVQRRNGAWLDMCWHAAPVLRSRDHDLLFAVTGCLVDAPIETQHALTAKLGHELASPLNALTSCIGENSASSNEPATHKIAAAVDSLRSVADQIRDIGDLVQGRVTLSRRALSLSALLQAAIDRVRDTTTRHIASPVLPEHFPDILADADKLSNVFIECLRAIIQFRKEDHSSNSQMRIIVRRWVHGTTTSSTSLRNLAALGASSRARVGSSSSLRSLPELGPVSTSRTSTPPNTGTKSSDASAGYTSCAFDVEFHDFGSLPRTEVSNVLDSVGITLARRLVALHGGKVRLVEPRIRAPSSTTASDTPPLVLAVQLTAPLARPHEAHVAQAAEP